MFDPLCPCCHNPETFPSGVNLYTISQILSVTLFEKVPHDHLFANHDYKYGPGSKKQLCNQLKRWWRRSAALKERFQRVARRYEVEITWDEKTSLATQIAWQRREQDDRSGFYCLGSNRLHQFEIIRILTGHY